MKNIILWFFTISIISVTSWAKQVKCQVYQEGSGSSEIVKFDARSNHPDIQTQTVDKGPKKGQIIKHIGDTVLKSEDTGLRYYMGFTYYEKPYESSQITIQSINLDDNTLNNMFFVPANIEGEITYSDKNVNLHCNLIE